ncbi:MAG: calcium:proton antiporter [Salaquimonas sp.]|nr:calcium:proton antiporter [Salaquimonas sp.]
MPLAPFRIIMILTNFWLECGAMLRTIRSEAAFIVTALSAVVFYTIGKAWLDNLGHPILFTVLFLWLFGAMLWSSFSAVRHADCLAILLGEPFGTLVLTISVISIEVSVIAAVMLHAGPNPTLARDTMLAVLIIVLDGMVGLSLLLGGIRHREQSFNLQGARSYLSVIITLATLSLILPRFTTSTTGPTLTTAQGLLFSAVTVLLYGVFLAIQTIRHRDYFVVRDEIPAASGPDGHDDGHHKSLKPRSVVFHAIFLLLTLVPIVLLSKKLAVVVDFATESIGLPEALGGVLVAILVLAPEGLAAFESALGNHLQRAVNICLGSALATISLTVPAVVVIGLISGIHVELGLDPTEMVLLLLTLVISMLTFGAVRTNLLQGAVHLVVFFAYLVLIFQP